MQIKAKDLADILEISPSTVSMVLNNKPGVAEKTRLQIMNKVHELGCDYLIKNVHAFGSSNEIGLVVYKRTGRIVNDSPFFTYLLESINNSLHEKGLTLSILYIEKDSGLAEKNAQLFTRNYSGLIVFAVEMQRDDLAFFENCGIPYVLFDNSFPELNINTISVNNVQGIHQSMDYLYANNHRKIGYIRSKTQITSFTDRYEQYTKELANHGIPFNENYVFEVGYSDIEASEDVANYISTVSDLPTAFLADNDIIACNCIAALKRHGFKIPNDISFIGFDNRTLCTLINPPLTTINIPAEFFGPTIVRSLMNVLSGKKQNTLHIEVSTNLIERSSVKKL